MFKNKIIINFVTFKATKNRFSPYPSFVAVELLDTGSKIGEPRSRKDKSQDPGSGLNTPDPHHCKEFSF
jgi:hypothetical protein